MVYDIHLAASPEIRAATKTSSYKYGIVRPCLCFCGISPASDVYVDFIRNKMDKNTHRSSVRPMACAPSTAKRMNTFGTRP